MPEKLVIIGSGPAAWTAAIYAARANLQPLVFAGRPKQVPTTILPGGQLMLTTEIENYPGFPHGITGPKLMAYMEQQAVRFGTRIQTDDGQHPDVSNPDDGHSYKYHDCARVDLSTRPFKVYGEDGQVVETHALIVATGATANWLNLPNEQRLARSGGGVSACAVCDGALPIFHGKELGVVGGGDSAIEEATYLTKFASKVHIIHRRGELRASKIMQKRALNNPKINVLWHKVVTDVLGEQMITGVKLRDTRTGEETVKELGGLFIAIGHTPTTAFLEGQLELTEKGYIKLKDAYRTTTSVEGVFAAGDVADSVYRQAITAAGMGCKAAIDAERWLAEHGID
ncbi:MAG TPA: FAD-dependent oxidoreductase [Phycisphaerae bacterium]|jgi:thioredoxin reductase (NADPH)|nr:FAD-dependent oxidoreductase [Phycisphaerae bacterium]HOB75188.1 FAD-dependent oxidoreductase [Phycisphaerae bacterium]HOJ54669.1 FAD-dependent oxidoreductase [Phycisphaerae bacterium]HOL25981.1 FAD-dependent oxidoreductase [Phycisphaerae bacterium]HPP19447.1 FAD-dependent oxidoreductase [Phycisphaerae bacterium]